MDTTQGGVFHPYERLVRIQLLGKPLEVPEKNLLLRCFQYLCPDTIPFGRFCWNEECQYCRVVVMGLDGREHRVLSCKVLVRDGLEILWMDKELMTCMRKKLE